jgi:hypothetical protein
MDDGEDPVYTSVCALDGGSPILLIMLNKSTYPPTVFGYDK